MNPLSMDALLNDNLMPSFTVHVPVTPTGSRRSSTMDGGTTNDNGNNNATVNVTINTGAPSSSTNKNNHDGIASSPNQRRMTAIGFSTSPRAANGNESTPPATTATANNNSSMMATPRPLARSATTPSLASPLASPSNSGVTPPPGLPELRTRSISNSNEDSSNNNNNNNNNNTNDDPNEFWTSLAHEWALKIIYQIDGILKRGAINNCRGKLLCPDKYVSMSLLFIALAFCDS
jgi:hypothetical protein